MRPARSLLHTGRQRKLPVFSAMASQPLTGAERRTQTRVPGPFPVRMRAVGAGKPFETHTLADFTV